MPRGESAKGLGGNKDWGLESGVASSLLLNFCVRLRSKLSKINFHVVEAAKIHGAQEIAISET